MSTMVTVTVRCPQALLDRFRALADERDVSVTFLIRRAMERYEPPQLLLSSDPRPVL